MGRRVRALVTLAGLSVRAVLVMSFGAIFYGVLRLIRHAPAQRQRVPTDGYQTEESQRGEVTFRQRAAFGEPEAVLNLVQMRQQRRAVFQALVQRGVALSPFAELGAERGQTSLLLTHEFGALGAATDLSVDSLQVIPILTAHFAYSVQPLAVCCDILHLPFRDGALSFVFCFATLHHFDDLRPVLAEARRVVGKGGHFYFAEEPLRRTLCLNLYRCPRADKMDGLHRFLSRHELIQYIAEAFVGSKDESDYGIVENQSITLRQWEEALSIFDHWELVCDPLVTRDAATFEAALTQLGVPANRAHRTAANMFGSVVSGLCNMERGPEPARPEDLMRAFACPNCSAPLHFTSVFVCPSCGAFRRHGNVHMVLPREINDRLYGQRTQGD